MTRPLGRRPRKASRIVVLLTARLLKELDAAAEEHGTARSRYVRDLIEDDLARRKANTNTTTAF